MTAKPKDEPETPAEEAPANGEAAEVEAPPVEDAPKSKGKAVTQTTEYRRTVNAQWCPNDDTSVPVGTPTCPTCGFEFA